MSYTNWQDVANRYPGIARAGGAKDITSAYIYFAENEINGLLSEFFTVPFSANNVTAVDLAVELIYARIGTQKLSEADKIRDRVMKRIERIKAGTEAMMLSDGTYLTTIGGTVYSSDSEYHHTFGHGDVIDFHVDSSQTYAEEQERDY